MKPSQASPCIVVCDDDKANVLALEKVFSKEGMQVLVAHSGQEALDLCGRHPVDVVLTDLRMPAMDGIALLDALRDAAPDVEVVLMTAYATVERAVEAIKKGAYDFVEKPVRRAAIVKTVKKAVERHRLVIENKELRARLAKMSGFDEPVGVSALFRKTLDVARQAAASLATVLITGESGTGKEVVARYIHACSDRAEGPFVALNCAALPESILEAELFGYEPGAFTGAVHRREGRFAAAHGGTLLLDEVAEIPPPVQVSLLRVLQERVVEPLGGTPQPVDVRVLAATNKDLEEEVRAGRFREDLFYRLHVIPLEIPPLRHRVEDIPVLVDCFVRRHAAKNGRAVPEVTQEALAHLCAYDWPGNVRELENAVERAVVLAKGPVLDVADFPDKVVNAPRRDDAIVIPLGTPLDEVERRVLRATLRYTGGDKKRAAQLLGIATRTIYRKRDAWE